MAVGGAGGADELAADTSARIDPAELALLVSVFAVAACGLVYELAPGALASYLLGDSVLIDAGTGLATLSLEEMLRIDHVVLTHAHLDHCSALDAIKAEARQIF